MSGMIGEARSQDKHKSAEWYTPKWVFDFLGAEFDLDPCSPHDMDSQVPAKRKLTIFDDGLKNEWSGSVWLNPPYGKETGLWIDRMIEHDNGIALVFSRTDAKWCQKAMAKCSSMLFIAGRIDFIPGLENQHKKSRCGAGTVMFSFGKDMAIALSKMKQLGFYHAK